MNIPENLKFSEDHECVLLQGNQANVGITDYAQDALGDIVFVSLPKLGESYPAGSTLGEVESTKSVSDIYAPLGGKIVEVNTNLDSQPELLNSDPYGQGWICVIEVESDELPGQLLDPSAYRSLTEG